MGFQAIDSLAACCQKLIKDPGTYTIQKKHFLSQLNRLKPGTDAYYKVFNTFRLYNRAYLNWHPEATVKECQSYIIPRYETGAMIRDPESNFTSISENYRILCAEIEKNEQPNLYSLKTYYETFCKTYNLTLTT